MESPLRSIAKTISWRIIATLTTITIAYGITKKISLSLSIGAIEVITKMILYYFHERIWTKLNYGKTLKEQQNNLPKKKQSANLF